ncbi:hypothetical protein [Flavobacterium sp. 2]|uniref:hypothetical protein n=1 Tax=Flavobacterium sp. 2 TaxID=308053 RepID=UPI003CF9A9EC
MAKINNDSENEFHVGITMAGAVSAGCYTAGVMDYLFEILDLWENAKEGKFPADWSPELKKLVPKHKVIIDAMGGASAGGMTTVMAAIYAMKGKINPVKDPSNKSSIKKNLLYDSWVLMGDSENSNIKLFEKILELDDLQDGKIASLLNSNFIDSICDGAFIDDSPNDKKLPNYISTELEVLLSQALLRSIPLSIDFDNAFGSLRKKDNYPNYNTFEHFVISHFKLDYDQKLHKDFYLPFDPFKNQVDIDRLKLATKATGAFPIGLSFRKFFNNEFTSEYIKNNSRKLIFNKISPENIPPEPEFLWKDLPDPFNFVGVDGGAINNEPIGEVLNVLKERYGEKNKNEPDKFALIMIDPFPDHIYDKNVKHPEDIFSIIPSIIGTLQDQSKLKRREMLEFHTEKYFRGEIFPVRWYEDNNGDFQPEKDAIACSSVYAFGGFLDINFRHHDFFLGRDNARNFFKVYFSFEYDPKNKNVHPIHSKWSTEMVKAFKFTRDKKVFLPIIPDLQELKIKMDNGNKNRNPYERTVEKWPVYNPEPLFALAPKIEERVKKMLELTIVKFSDETKKSKHPITEKWIKKYYHEGLFQRIKGWLGNILIKVIIATNKKTIANKVAKATIEWILKDLEDKNMIK